MIVIKTDELNYLIYRYFQEQGLQHTAFALLNEGGLKEYSQRYHDEVRPGHLINHLEKSLLFQQLEDHVHMNQIYECNVPQQLIQRHVCQFTERKLHNMKQQAREKEVMLSSALNRSQEFQNHTSSKTGQTMDRFLTEEEFLKSVDYIQLHEQDEIVLSSWNPLRNLLATYHANLNCIQHMRCEGGQGQHGFKTQQIFPACIGETLHRVKLIKWDKAHGNYLLVLFENGVILITDSNCQIIKMFNVKNSSKIKRISWNKNWPNIATIVFEREIEIIDVFKCNTVRTIENVLDFEWRFFDQFIVMNQDFYLNLYQIDQDLPLLTLKADLETSLLEFNKSKTLLASFSATLNIIKVWTFQSDQFIFEITDDRKILQFCWCSSQNANYLITLTIRTLNIWDVEFGSIKCSYEIDGSVLSLYSLDLLGESPYITLTTSENKLLVYDLINRKRRIIQLTRLPQKIVKMNEDEVLLLFPTTVCVLNVKSFEAE